MRLFFFLLLLHKKKKRRAFPPASSTFDALSPRGGDQGGIAVDTPGQRH